METSLQQEPVALPGRPFGRMARSVAGYTLLTGLLFVTPLVFVFVPAALFQCALRNGRRAAWLVLLLATGLAALSIFQLTQVPAVHPDDVKMMYAELLGLVLAVAVQALAAQPLIERGEPFGRVLMFTTIGGAVGLFFTETLMRTVAAFSPYGWYVQKFREAIALSVKQAGMPAAYAQMAEKSELLTICLPAMVMTLVISVFVVSLAVFARLDAWRNGGERSRVYLFRNLSLPDWLLFAFVLGGITPLATGTLRMVTANVLAVVTFLYFLRGLAIFRSMLAAMGMSPLGVMIAFLFIGFLIIFIAAWLLLSIAGLFDSFFDFRHFKRKDDSHEGHSD
ncbi:MAG TPA: DUF2232 domain-containing protein [Thermoanaerobaculia bacterium]|nr:DUF2232 domain-containing protein [Thermoanaerobaculia bacterium]